MTRDVVSIQLEWAYFPVAYLEGPLVLNFDGCAIEINNGKAVAALKPVLFESNKDIENILTYKLEGCFLAVQLLTHKDFDLSGPVRTDILEDGKRTVYIEFHDSVSISSTVSEGLTVKGEDNSFMLDTRQERLNKQLWLADVIGRHRPEDETLAHMLQSYKRSVNDLDNELVHLYEIREALVQCYGSKKKVIKELQIKECVWDELGRLANALPLKQGRHRGCAVGQLREASQAELSNARAIGRDLIKSYLQALEKNLTANNGG